MKATVLLNASAGWMAGANGAATLKRVREAFASVNVAAQVLALDHAGLAEAAVRAASSDVDAVVLGGGDGTVNTGAAAIAGSPKALGILPLGTLNHFAKDAGIPLDFDEAVATIAAGVVREVDVGEVNGRVFINNSSVGLYPSAVDQRDELRHQHGGGKTSAMLNASADVFRRFPLLDVTLQVNDRAVALRTPFVFVGNNRYDMSLFSLGRRTTLDGGELGVYLTRTTNRFGVLRLACRALIGRMKQDRDFRYFTIREIEIRSRRRSLRVALDGEVVQMTSPIRYSIRPRALRVLAPPPEPPPEDA
ncbi:MAG: hypothetical protein JJE39_00800 [Vicinamibacteria bacterium]|nr:hypothetical protein [Vicinamibacteria bacterium]